MYTPGIGDATIDLVVTSPPFANVNNYGRDAWMRGWFSGVDLDKVGFAHHRSLGDWRAMIHRTLIELLRVVKPGGYRALEVGEIRRGTFGLERLVWQAAEGLQCNRLAVIFHDSAFTKSAHCHGVENGNLGTNSNRILVMQRH